MARSSDGIPSKNNAVPRLLQAACAAADRDMWSDAEKLLNEAIGIDPQCVDAYVKLGLIFDRKAV